MGFPACEEKTLVTSGHCRDLHSRRIVGAGERECSCSIHIYAVLKGLDVYLRDFSVLS